MDQELKVRENKARRAAARRGWTLEKSRARDPNALGFGRYLLLDVSGKPISPGYLPDIPFSATLEQIEEMLS